MHELLKFLKKREVGYKQLVDFMQSCGSDDFPEPDPELAAGALSAERNLGNSSRLHLRGKGPVVDECGLEGPIMVYGLERQSLMGNCDTDFSDVPLIGSVWRPVCVTRREDRRQERAKENWRHDRERAKPELILSLIQFRSLGLCFNSSCCFSSRVCCPGNKQQQLPRIRLLFAAFSKEP